MTSDCISRQAVLDEISKSVDHSLYAYKSLMECVKTLPFVNPQEPKQGHWIWDAEKTYCKCSECGIGMGHTEFDYCPNCGAKMESESKP